MFPPICFGDEFLPLIGCLLRRFIVITCVRIFRRKKQKGEIAAKYSARARNPESPGLGDKAKKKSRSRVLRQRLNIMGGCPS